jgi:3-oxoacyl-[acyl-carrier protein] reductase
VHRVLDFAGKRAVVTGGTRGIGRATADMFRAAGAEVITVSRSTHGDLSDPCTSEKAAEVILGPLHALVLNHGVWVANGAALAAMPPSQWHSTIAQNLDSYFYVVRAFVPRLADGASIVFVASTAAQRGEAFHADYAASKGAIVSLTKSLAIELAPRIRVNCVAPGWVDTAMAAQPYADGGRARIEAGIPLGRVASPEDVAGPILFLCSDLARHVTGEVLNVNGGSVLCG